MRGLDFILDLLYPPRCAFCRGLLKDGEEGCCHKCRGALPYVPGEKARRDIDEMELCIAPLYYEGSVRESLLRYKFGSLTGYGKIYADFIRKAIDENQISCDIITWVPLSRKRLRKRGYDQAEIIARYTADKLGLLCQRLLVKTVDTRAQSGIGGAEARRRNAAGVYALMPEADVKNKCILLLDDIVTTGSTLSECARVLKCAGCTAVYGAAAATRQDLETN